MNHPSTIVLDTSRVVADFRRHALETGETDYFVYEVLSSVIANIDNKDMAEYQIREFVAEVEFAEHLDSQGLKPEHASAILRLGLEVLGQIRALNIFDEQGHMPYEFSELNYNGSLDIILSHIQD